MFCDTGIGNSCVLGTVGAWEVQQLNEKKKDFSLMFILKDKKRSDLYLVLHTGGLSR